MEHTCSWMIGLVCSGHCTASSTRNKRVHSLRWGVAMRSSQMTGDELLLLLAICCPNGCTVASGDVVVNVSVVVVVGICNHSQMRTSKCTCLIFGISVGLDPGYKQTKGIFDRSKFKVICDISPTISGWLIVIINIIILFIVSYGHAQHNNSQ